MAIKDYLPSLFGQKERTPAVAQQDSLGPISYTKKAKPPHLGTEGLLHGYSDMPWLNAVASKIGEAVGETSWRVYRVNDSRNRALENHRVKHLAKEGRDTVFEEKARLGNLEEVESHSLLDFLFYGNEYMDGMASLKITQIHLDLVGEAFWILERNGVGGPIAWYPFPPHWIQDFPGPERQSYLVKMPNGMEQEIPKNEVIHFVNPDPANPYGRGVGTAQALGDELEIDDYSSKFVKSHFYNNARPDLIISAENMSESEARRLDKQWRAEHQGFFRAFKPIFMSRKVDVKEIAQNFEHLQLVNLKEFERNQIISVFGVSPEMVGVIENSNRASIDSASYFFSRFTVQPRQEQIRTTLQNKLVPMFDDTLILDFDSIVPEDKERKAELMTNVPWAFTLDEFRKEVGHDPLPDEDGQARMLPLNMVEVGLDEDPPKPENGDQNIQLESQELRSMKKKIVKQYGDLGETINTKLAKKLVDKRKSNTYA